MGLISQTVKHSKSAQVAAVEPDKTISHVADEIDWEERHFRICLALLANPEFSSRASVSYPQIIDKADRMIEALKQHHNKQ